MDFISTRGGVSAPPSQAIIKGISDNGGLFVPSSIPRLDIDFNSFPLRDYKSHAALCLSPFLGDFRSGKLESCIGGAYDFGFDTPEIAPLINMGDVSFLELFHGKTLAFKDMALSMLPHLMAEASKNTQQTSTELVILTATSGDTGGAALESFKDIDGVKIIVFYPEEGTSVLQKRQMITQEGKNTHVIGIKGNFDDAQSAVKDIFADLSVANQLAARGISLSSANSINIGRLLPQIAYYFYAYSQLVAGGMTPGEKISFVVPTGNFGNILAGYYAKRMGLPINKLICASNDNNVLFDFFSTGIFHLDRKFISTISPSMDILVPSNFERLLFDLLGRDFEKLKWHLYQLKNCGRYSLDIPDEDFTGFYAHEDEVRGAIKEVWEKRKYLIDPHTAVAYCAYKKYSGKEKAVILSTASPYKFTKTVLTSIDQKYCELDDFALIQSMSDLVGQPIPRQISSIRDKPILHKKVVESGDMKNAVLSVLL